MEEQETLHVCEDCVIALANDDYSAIEDEARADEVRRGVHELGPCAVLEGPSDEFSSRACECCGTRLAGSRHPVAPHGATAPRDPQRDATLVERDTRVEQALRAGIKRIDTIRTDLENMMNRIDSLINDVLAHEKRVCDAITAQNWCDLHELLSEADIRSLYEAGGDFAWLTELSDDEI